MWDDSLLSRDEADARTKRKAEAVMKRERALAYSYSHQVRTYVLYVLSSRKIIIHTARSITSVSESETSKRDR